MASASKEYIEALNSFTYALDQLVQTLVAKEKESGSGGSEVLEEFFTSSADKFKIVEAIAEDVKDIKEDIVASNKKSDEILRTVKAIKENKDKGIFEKLGEEDDKNAIVEGVKTIVLIAGAVLAIGLAFSVIGKVDFVSVIALSIALPLIAHAFATLADIGNLDYNTAINMGLILVIISTAMVAASHILTLMAEVRPEIFLTAVVIGAILIVVAISASMLLEVLDDVSIKDIFMLGLKMVVISVAIVLASLILQFTVPIPFWDIIMASIAIGVAIIAMAVTLWVVNKLLTLKDAIQGSIMLIVISAAIMISSHIIGIGNYDNYPGIDWVLGVGLSLLLLTPAILLLGVPALVPFVLIGSLMLVIVSTAIMVASHILNEGNYENYPSLVWAAGVGLVMALFAPLTLLMGGIGILWPIVTIGLALMLTIADTIVDLSHILANGNFSGMGGIIAWATGVTMLFSVFAPMILILGTLAAGFSILGALGGPDPVESGTNMLKKVAKTIVDLSVILSEGTYKGGPTAAWATGVTMLFSVFAPMILILGALGGPDPVESGTNILKKVAKTIVDLSVILSEGTYKGGPTAAWAVGVGGSLIAFTRMLTLLSFFNIVDVMDSILKIKVIALVMTKVAGYLNVKSAYFSGGPTKEWAEGVGGSLVAFSEAIFNIGEVNIVDVMDSILKIKVIAFIMTKIAGYLNKNHAAFSRGPSEKWAKGVGDSLVLFSETIANLEDIDLVDVMGSVKKLQVIAATMVKVGMVFTKHHKAFSKGPSEKWAKGVGGSLVLFSETIANLEDIDLVDVMGSVKKLQVIAAAMVKVGMVFTEDGDIFNISPPKAFIENIEAMITSFSKIYGKLESITTAETITKMKEIVQSYIDMAKMMKESITGREKMDPFLTAAKGIDALANAFIKFGQSIQSMRAATKDLTAESIDMIRLISTSIMALSTVNANNLENVLGKLKPEDIAKLYEMSTEAAGRSAAGTETGATTKGTKATGVTKSTSTVEAQRQTKELISIKKELVKMNSAVSRIVLNTDEMLEIKSTNSDGTSITH